MLSYVKGSIVRFTIHIYMNFLTHAYTCVIILLLIHIYLNFKHESHANTNFHNCKIIIILSTIQVFHTISSHLPPNNSDSLSVSLSFSPRRSCRHSTSDPASSTYHPLDPGDDTNYKCNIIIVILIRYISMYFQSKVN